MRFDFYEEFCDFLVGGYIDRYENVGDEGHKLYRSNYLKYVQKEYYEPLKVCPGLWPKLLELSDYELEMSSSHCLHKKLLIEEKKFIHDQLIYYDYT